MNHSFDVSTIVFAALAIFIVWKLRSVLGTRTGEERPPFNPFAKRGQADPKGAAQTTQPMGQVIQLPGATPAPRPAAADPARWKGVAEENSPAIAGLDAIVAADPSFTGRNFLDGARAAYEMIVAAFAKGDRTALSGLLAPEVLDGFAAAIADRESRGETVQHTFVAMDKAQVEEASLRGKTATVTVRFDSQQINAVHARGAEVAADGSDAVGHVVDHWTFARDVSARDPNWKLVATNAE